MTVTMTAFRSRESLTGSATTHQQERQCSSCENDTPRPFCRNRSYHLASLCVALLSLSTPSSVAAFSPAVLKHQRSMVRPPQQARPSPRGRNRNMIQKRNTQASSSISLRSAVIQAYRLENDPHVSQPKHQSDVFSFLPSRLTSIQRVDTPSQFQTKVLDEQDSLVVVRFYADACPSCKATSPLFRKWSRDQEDQNVSESQAIKFLEMPLNKATSNFLQQTLQIDKMPTCQLYHPQLGLVEEQLIVNRSEFKIFVNVVDGWLKRDFEAPDSKQGSRKTITVNQKVKVNYQPKEERKSYGNIVDFMY